MRFIDFLNENTNSKSRTDKWTLDQIKNAKYSDSFMNDREEVCIKGKSYVKIGKNEWQYFSTNPHVIGGTYTDNEIYKMMHESVKNDDKIVFHSYKELKEYCDDPENPLDVVVLGKEIVSLAQLFSRSTRTNKQFKGIEDWDVSNVKDMRCMFSATKSFNRPLNNWDVSSVVEMSSMFYNAEKFNQPLDNWNVSNVRYMSYMFAKTATFDQPLNNWDVSKVEHMAGMFFNATTFNQSLNNWDVSNVKDMEGMFCDALSFNQPLDKWDVSNVKYMKGMFEWAKSFNQPLNKWDVSNVEYMNFMFCEAKSFNQSLDNWDVSKVKSMTDMFDYSKLERTGNLPNWYNE